MELPTQAMVHHGIQIKSLDQIERDHIEMAIKLLKGNVTAICKVLGVSRSTFYRRVTYHDFEQKLKDVRLHGA